MSTECHSGYPQMWSNINFLSEITTYTRKQAPTTEVSRKNNRLRSSKTSDTGISDTGYKITMYDLKKKTESKSDLRINRQLQKF